MGDWLTRFTPDEYVASLSEVNLDKLRQLGKRVLLCDLDNTLVAWRTLQPPAELAVWLDGVTAAGFRVCVVSNGEVSRVQAFADQLRLPAVGAARKPRRAAYTKALSMMNVQATEAVMIGDQLFTDIRGGNRSGLYTILVLPISSREWWGTRWVRLPERAVLRRLHGRGLVAPLSRAQR